MDNYNSNNSKVSSKSPSRFFLVVSLTRLTGLFILGICIIGCERIKKPLADVKPQKSSYVALEHEEHQILNQNFKPDVRKSR